MHTHIAIGIDIRKAYAHDARQLAMAVRGQYTRARGACIYIAYARVYTRSCNNRGIAAPCQPRPSHVHRPGSSSSPSGVHVPACVRS